MDLSLPPMSDPSTTPMPRETLQGDRICTQCLHPLAGRTVEREPTTGLLFVRCGECGTASALFEYPTATPWINRIKAVAASTIVALALLASIALAAISGGFLAGSVGNAMDGVTARISFAYRESLQRAGKDPDQQQQQQSAYYADEAWLATDEGRAAVAAARWTPVAWAPLCMIAALGSAMATPFVLLIGIGLMRFGAVRRVVFGALPVVIGVTAGGMLFLSATGLVGRIPTQSRAWAEVANQAHAAFLTTAVGTWFTLYAAGLLLIAPGLATLFARTVLPPADRRLVAWLWEWRGKTVPRD